MKITMKTSQVIELFQNITDFLKKDIDLPKQLVWDLDDNYETLKGIVSKFEKFRDKLFDPFNQKGAFEQLEDDKLRIKEEFMEDFNKVQEEINEYLETDNEIDIKTANRKDLPDNISLKDWQALKFMCTNK